MSRLLSYFAALISRIVSGLFNAFLYLRWLFTSLYAFRSYIITQNMSNFKMFVKQVTISRIDGDVVILIFSRKWLSVNKATFCIYFSSKRCKVET